MRIVLLGLTITSTWGNGHATTYRALVKALHRRGHSVTFLERDVPWYQANRDQAAPQGADVHLYGSLADLEAHRDTVAAADVVVIGSYVPDGKEVADWALRHARGTVAFYDIDTPVTMQGLEDGTCPYLDRDLVARFDTVFSFSTGPVLDQLVEEFGAQRAAPLACSVDPEAYPLQEGPRPIALGYLGTYSADRQDALDRLLLQPARHRPDERFVVAGPQYPASIQWPPNVERIEHLSQPRHAAFYGSQRWTLNVTRAAMVRRGHSPSVRLFEAAATGTPVISDRWVGLEAYFTPGAEIVIADGPEDVLAALDMTDAQRQAIAKAAYKRVMAEHTADHRAAQFEAEVGVIMA